MATLAKSEYLDDHILNWLRNNTAMPTMPSAVYVGLYTTMPNSSATGTQGSGGGVEVTAGNYARQAVTFGAPVDNTSTGDAISNTAQVSFPIASVAYGSNVVGIGIFDALTSGNLLYFGLLGTPITVAIGNQVQFAVNTGLTITEQ